MGSLTRRYSDSQLQQVAEGVSFRLAAVLARSDADNELSIKAAIGSLNEVASNLDANNVQFAIAEISLTALNLIQMSNCRNRDTRRDIQDLLRAIGKFIGQCATERSLIALRSGSGRQYLGL